MKKIRIDSSTIDEVTVGLVIDGEVIEEVKATKKIRGSQVILSSIDILLKKTQMSLQEIDSIDIHPGPGSYTGLRVGASIANTFGFCLGIPLNNGKVGSFVYPRYE